MPPFAPIIERFIAEVSAPWTHETSRLGHPSEPWRTIPWRCEVDHRVASWFAVCNCVRIVLTRGDLLDTQRCEQIAICFPLGNMATLRDNRRQSRPGLFIRRSRVRDPPGSFPKKIAVQRTPIGRDALTCARTVLILARSLTRLLFGRSR